MPTYAYACTGCDHAFDAVQSFTDASLTECPACGGRLRKQYGSIGVTFNGPGFYRTDSRDSPSRGGSKDGSTAVGDSKGGDTTAASGGSSARASGSGGSNAGGSGAGGSSSDTSTGSTASSKPKASASPVSAGT